MDWTNNTEYGTIFGSVHIYLTVEPSALKIETQSNPAFSSEGRKEQISYVAYGHIKIQALPKTYSGAKAIYAKKKKAEQIKL